MSLHLARCASCKTVLTVEVIVDLDAITKRLDRIEQALTTEGVLMSEIDDQLAQVDSEVDALRTDLARELADFAAAISGKLTVEEQAQLAGIHGKLAGAVSDIDAADPQPAAPTA